MPQLLLELFSEEIPARMQSGAARDLERMASERLKAAGLTWDALTTYAGPRRLTLVIEGLPAATPDRSEELKGPRANAPEQALEGFLRKTGLTRDQLTERDGVLFAVIDQKGVETTAVVAETVEHVIRNFPWPKSMRWADATLRWVRPLKRIVCLFDGKVVPFAIADGSPEGRIVSRDTTEGHRFLGSGQPFAVRDFADYRTKLEQQFVLLDVADRKLKILEAARAACQAKGLELVDDDGLLEEVAGLAEWPTPTLGDMDPQFLDLPPEVVRLSMKVHQKYFAVRDPQTGKLAPNFIVVANVEASDGGVALAAGNSRVLSARLNDARFFWDEDQKVGFDAWLEKLSGVTFHAKLGTMAKRVDRISALAREIAPLVGADADQAEKAARLAKADLASGMVGEFPELQGIMGGYYARAFGQPDAIADAVRDHYKPQGPADTVPTAPLTVAVALADKLDTLVGFFAIDEKPTGSKDPFALRRAALGVIRLVLDNGHRLPLTDVCEYAMRGAGPERPLAISEWTKTAVNNENGRKMNSEIEVGYEVVAFFADRLKVLLRDQGERHDLVDAVFALGDDDLVRIVRRVEALDAFLATDDGANLLAGYRRASNILKAEEKKGAVPTGMVQTGLPNQPPAETQLAMAVAAASNAVDQALETEDFAAAMTALAALRAPVDAFFTDVLVNSNVAEERENRLKLLGQVRAVMGKVADFGQVAG
ncbi:glycine--tRNA ligase subunit beta [Brevundimonas sp. NIBR11]|uniref:glycine--tRNA ligase subunit beta n=1 Tax=Brevundimonas sp. NIBR11 TaxID=3015999 RepID=UPI0022F11DB2|nr:glycine--tRNA ligase subunit beta [Brevundimonas sp. NIBR11]WGM30320.1 Glycine--tRNA ligase beta subunit [Brevundimonas sp. NIBR11]